MKMSSVTFDLTRFHIPNKLFIDGAWTDGEANNAQSMVSAVNDEVICKGELVAYRESSLDSLSV